MDEGEEEEEEDEAEENILFLSLLFILPQCGTCIYRDLELKSPGKFIYINYVLDHEGPSHLTPTYDACYFKTYFYNITFVCVIRIVLFRSSRFIIEQSRRISVSASGFQGNRKEAFRLILVHRAPLIMQMPVMRRWDLPLNRSEFKKPSVLPCFLYIIYPQPFCPRVGLLL